MLPDLCLTTCQLLAWALVVSCSFAPPSRQLVPLSIYRTTGDVSPSSNFSDVSSSRRLQGPGASITYDFGQMVAGYPTLTMTDLMCDGGICSHTSNLPGFNCGSGCQGLGLAYTEAAEFVGPASDNSIFYSHADSTLYLPLITNVPYTVPTQWARGSFRYLTLSLDNATSTSTAITVGLGSIQFTAAQDIPDSALQESSGYFDSSDSLLNRIWKAGVYTLQLCRVSANTSVQHTYLVASDGWANNAAATSLASTDVYIADGAKRDRNPWAGDLSISLRSSLVSQNFYNLRAVKRALQECMLLQDTNLTSPTYGYFPYAGSPLGNLLITYGSLIDTSAYGSDTYHLWTIISFIDYVILSQDYPWAAKHWSQISMGLDATQRFVNTNSGLVNGTGSLDWGRIGAGGQNIALNALWYHTLTRLSRFGAMLNATEETRQGWSSRAGMVKTAVNSLLFNAEVGLFQDNTTAAGASIFPQDGNVMAVNFGLTDYSRTQQIGRVLASRHNAYGALAPELPGGISPFITSHELNAQFIANPGDASVPLALLRKQWGYMLQTFSNTTMIEGYASDGSLAYPFYPNGSSFISHAHAWSTGPVYTLLHDVVGLHSAIDVDAEDGQWAFKPVPAGSDLTFAKGGYNTTAGLFAANWTITSATTFEAHLSIPLDISGTIYIPTFGVNVCNLTATLGIQSPAVIAISYVDNYFRLSGVPGGNYHIKLVSLEEVFLQETDRMRCAST